MRKFNTACLCSVMLLFLAHAFQKHAGHHTAKRPSCLCDGACSTAEGYNALCTRLIDVDFDFWIPCPMLRGCFGAPSTTRNKRRLKSPDANINQSISHNKWLCHNTQHPHNKTAQSSCLLVILFDLQQTQCIHAATLPSPCLGNPMSIRPQWMRLSSVDSRGQRTRCSGQDASFSQCNGVGKSRTTPWCEFSGVLLCSTQHNVLLIASELIPVRFLVWLLASIAQGLLG
jgi:hypothetical protein